MRSTVAAPDRSMEFKTLDGVRPQMLKAPAPVNASQIGLTALVRDGLIRACGSLKSAAIDMEIDQGQLTRELESGAFKFARLDKLDAGKRAIVIGRMHDEYATLLDPKALVEAAVARIVENADIVRQFLRHIA